MRIVYRSLAVALALLAVAFSVAAQEELFPRPAALEPAVQFWTRVYTEVDTKSGFIHDSLRMDIVYQTVRFPDDSARERRRRVERATEATRTILTKLAGGARQNLSNDEERVLKLFPRARATPSSVRPPAGCASSSANRIASARASCAPARGSRTSTRCLAKRGLPPELAALPHVESSFDPTAYSKVGAAGMWQFMRSTGVRYMRIDHIVDERRDPFFATDAAARLLADNFSVIQSWPLALTAYNHGLASMRRAVQQQKTNDIATIVAKYQSRSFGFASRNFYTAFLAALEIDSNPEQYFPNLKINSAADTATIAVPAFMTVDTLADALNIRESALRDLNPALTDIVWSGDKYVPQGFELRVPRDTAAVAEALLGAIDAKKLFAAQRADREHRVRRGDTLSKIASEYRVSLAALMRVNGMTQPHRDPRRANDPAAGRRRDGARRRDARSRRGAVRRRAPSRRPGAGRDQRRRRLRRAPRRQHRAHRGPARRRAASARRRQRHSQPQRDPGRPAAHHSERAGRRGRRRRREHSVRRPSTPPSQQRSNRRRQSPQSPSRPQI